MKHLLIVVFLLNSFPLAAQFNKPKFGDIEISDLQMSVYAKDTTAEALVLFDDGNSSFNLNSNREFQILYERHFRIKIFKKSAADLADITLKLYQKGNYKESLSGFKGMTYNLVNGKIVKTKLTNDMVFETKDKRYTIKKIAFPEVREGSIIEFSYTILSDLLYNFRGWVFQYDYPALWSQYSYVIPEYFSYRRSAKGYLDFDVNIAKEGTKNFIVHYEAEVVPGIGGGRTPTQNYNLEASTNVFVLGVKDVPAFISEPDIDCEENYLQSVEFELNSIKMPDQPLQVYTSSWETVNNEMDTDEDFGNLLKSGAFISDTLAFICKGASSDLEKAIRIYYYVQNRMKWNGDYSLWSEKGLKKPYIDRIGNTSEINLLLTLMLRNAGLMANPVLFSTRENGIPFTYLPTISKFNSVLTQLEVGGKIYLLDPVNKYCPFGILPPPDLNTRGRVINNRGGDWVSLEPAEKYSETKEYNLEITADGSLKGTVTGSYDGYAGVAYRYLLSFENSLDDYFRKMQENEKGLTITSYSIADRFNPSKPLSDTMKIEVDDHIEFIGDKILFNPMLFEQIEKNRYTLEQRNYPVNYSYPSSRKYVFNYSLPEGYQVEFLPKSGVYSLPDNSISFSYSLQNIGNKIKIEYFQDIKKILFLPEEYQNLKKIYDQIMNKQAEQIMIKKTL